MQLEAWFEERAVQLDAVTGQLNAAIGVIEAGMQLLGDSNRLQSLRSKAVELQDAVSAGTTHVLEIAVKST